MKNSITTQVAQLSHRKRDMLVCNYWSCNAAMTHVALSNRKFSNCIFGLIQTEYPSALWYAKFLGVEAYNRVQKLSAVHAFKSVQNAFSSQTTSHNFFKKNLKACHTKNKKIKRFAAASNHTVRQGRYCFKTCAFAVLV